MNPLYLIGIIGGAVLIIIASLKKPKDESLPILQDRIKQRKRYLPQLKDTTDKMLIRMRELAVVAGQLPLEQYYDRYLKLNKTYQRVYRLLALTHKDEIVRRKVAIVVALHYLKMSINNVYQSELEDTDTTMISLMKDYNTYRPRNKDKKLSKGLDILFKDAKRFYSCLALAELAKNNDFPFKSPKYVSSFYDKPRKLEAILGKRHNIVNERFDELLSEGVPDE